MASFDVPSWNEVGVIPPMDMNNPASAFRSPYKTDIVKLVERYATSPQRIAILNGFINFRSELHKTGLTNGFQWVDGSFNENIEVTENRPPNDIDVVTFFSLDENVSQQHVVSRNPDLFLPQQAKWRKKHFKVDSYLQSLQVPNDKLVEKTVYWYSMWSHRRDLTWKGFLQIPLSPQLDEEAKSLLDSMAAEGGEQ